MKFFSCSTSEKRDAIAVKRGNIIFDQEERAIYLDIPDASDPTGEADVRQSYQQIITISTETARTSLAHPIRGFYFVTETCHLFKYDGSWHEVTTTIPPDEDQIYFGARAEFPVVGNPEMIYVDGTTMYRYLEGEYKTITGSSASIEWERV